MPESLDLRARGLRAADPDKALLPPCRKDGSFRTEAVRVIAMCLVKLRKLPDGGINQVGALGMIARIYVCFNRLEGNWRQLHLLRVDRLAADYDNLGVTRDLTGGPNNTSSP